MTVYIKESDYDAGNDILFLGFVDNAKDNSYGDEPTDGIVVFTDINTAQPRGLLIFDPKRAEQERARELKELGYDINLFSYIH